MKIDLQNILSGNFLAQGWIKKQYKLLLLIAVLVIIYIIAGYHAQMQHHRLTELKKELEDARFTQLTMRTQVLNQTRQSHIAEQLQERNSNVKESKYPITCIPR